MFGPKIKLNKELFEKCKRHALEKGYSSVEEFVTHLLEKELRNQNKISQDEEKEIEKKLKGLGYLR